MRDLTMKKTLIRLVILFGILSIINCYAAKPVTCPTRPGFVTCPDNVITMNPQTTEWQSRINLGSGQQCTGNKDYYFKFDTAQYNNKSKVLECLYLAENKVGEVIAALRLITQNYRVDNTAYSQWQLDGESYDCGYMTGTLARDCPIKQPTNAGS
jgi:hypothetical protein